MSINSTEQQEVINLFNKVKMYNTTIFDYKNKVTNFQSKMINLANFIRFINNNKDINENIYPNITTDLIFNNINESSNNTYEENSLFNEVISNQELLKFIAENDYISDIINITSFSDFIVFINNINRIIKMKKKSIKMRGVCRIQSSSSGINSALFNSSISLGSNIPYAREMSRSVEKSSGGLKTVYFPFNPF